MEKKKKKLSKYKYDEEYDEEVPTSEEDIDMMIEIGLLTKKAIMSI